MIMLKIYLVSIEDVLSAKIEKVFPARISLSDKSTDKAILDEVLEDDSNIIIMDSSYLSSLKNTLPKAKVIIASKKYDMEKEYLSVVLGARGFITKDINEQSLRKAVDVVDSGEFWMTRSVASKVFNVLGNNP